LAPEIAAAIRSELGVEGLFVAYVGGFGFNRALLELVKAVRSVEGVFLILAGDGQQRPEIERAIAGYPRIRYLGVIPYDYALELKGVADVVYRVARIERTPNARYSAPNSLFEALAGGTAVIVSDNGDMGRIVREEGCGIVLDRVGVNQIAEALQALRDPEVLSLMKRNALRAAERRYNWTEATARLIRLYERMVDS
jgi:glycosyltransferase involved in cell wall biosynthesis